MGKMIGQMKGFPELSSGLTLSATVGGIHSLLTLRFFKEVGWIAGLF